MVDELGDVLFQVLFLSLLLEERGKGSLADVADRMREKLIRRHPHVFGEVEVEGADDVVRNWDQIKRGESGSIFGDLPETLPSTLLAGKVQRRAGLDEDDEALVGRLLFDAVALARRLKVDPELALRAHAKGFVQGASQYGGSMEGATE